MTRKPEEGPRRGQGRVLPHVLVLAAQYVRSDHAGLSRAPKSNPSVSSLAPCGGRGGRVDGWMGGWVDGLEGGTHRVCVCVNGWLGLAWIRPRLVEFIACNLHNSISVGSSEMLTARKKLVLLAGTQGGCPSGYSVRCS